MKSFLIVLLFGNTLLISCQERQNEKFIEQFVIDLFDDNIAPKTVVETYLEVRKDTTNSKITPNQRLKAAKDFILETRKPIGADVRGKWLIPNYAIKEIKNPKVYPFNDYEHLSIISISKIDSIRDRVYVLLDEEKKEILQYILLNESETKISHYTLLVKDSKDGFFFRAY